MQGLPALMLEAAVRCWRRLTAIVTATDTLSLDIEAAWAGHMFER
jgi:hypothetical protein